MNVIYIVLVCNYFFIPLNSSCCALITSGKNFIKITSVGMGAAKSNETR